MGLPEGNITRVGLREFLDSTADGKTYTRRVGASDWQLVELGPGAEAGAKAGEGASLVPNDPRTASSTSNTAPDIPLPRPFPLSLLLVRHFQSPGEPDHWALFLGPEAAPGHVYEVTGDATFMTFQFGNAVDITAREDFKDAFVLTQVETENQAKLVDQAARNEPPPQAPNRASVTENCQGWLIRVAQVLVGKGIIRADKVDMARELLEKV